MVRFSPMSPSEEFAAAARYDQRRFEQAGRWARMGVIVAAFGVMVAAGATDGTTRKVLGTLLGLGIIGSVFAGMRYDEKASQTLKPDYLPNDRSLEAVRRSVFSVPQPL